MTVIRHAILLNSPLNGHHFSSWLWFFPHRQECLPAHNPSSERFYSGRVTGAGYPPTRNKMRALRPNPLSNKQGDWSAGSRGSARRPQISKKTRHHTSTWICSLRVSDLLLDVSSSKVKWRWNILKVFIVFNLVRYKLIQNELFSFLEFIFALEGSIYTVTKILKALYR